MYKYLSSYDQCVVTALSHHELGASTPWFLKPNFLSSDLEGREELMITDQMSLPLSLGNYERVLASLVQ